MVAPDFVNRGRELSAGGHHIEAIKVCRLGLLANPAALDGRLVLASALLALARYDEVLAEIRVVMQSRPRDDLALRIKGEALLGRGEPGQALEIFEKLSRESEDPTLLGLLEDARDSANSATTGAREDSVSWTRDYPAHHADGDSVTDHFADYNEPPTIPAEPDGATEVEEARFVLGTADTMLVSSPRTDAPEDDFDSEAGTVEVDPSLIRPRPDLRTPPLSSASLEISLRQTIIAEASGSIELSVADLVPMERPPHLDASSEELSLVDLIPATDPSALAMPVKPSHNALPGGMEEVRGFDGDFAGTPSDTTHAYGRERDYARPESVPAEAPLFLDREPDRPKSTSFPTDLPRQVPRIARPVPAPAPRLGAPPVSDLFPEDEDGVSKLELLDPVSGAVRPMEKAPGPHHRMPPGVIDVARPLENEPIHFGAGRPVTRHDDMRTIRVGLGMAPDPSRQNMDVPVLPAPIPAPAPLGKPPRLIRDAPPTERVAPHSIERIRGGRPRLPLPLIAAVGVLTIGGGIAAGVGVRSWRQGRSVERAAERAAELGASGSYLDQLRARALIDRVLERADRASLQALRLRIGSSLAAEFGVDDSSAGVIADTDNSANAHSARVYRALAMGDADGALVAADAYAAAFPKSADASYLRGLALADLGQLEAAAAALRQPSEKNPLARARLADVLRLSGAPAEAAKQAGDDSLPAIAIARARALARAAALPSGDEPESTLRKMVADGLRPPAEQEIGVSPSQSLDARLALIEVAIARGKSDLAKIELSALGDLKIAGGTRYRVAYAEALLRTGSATAAAAQYDQIIKDWPESARTRILGARIELARGDNRAARAHIEKLPNIEALPRGLAIRGQLALNAGRLQDAERDLSMALAASPGLEDAVLAVAQLELERGNYDKALQGLEALPAGLFGSARDILKARALRAAGRLDEARATLAQAAAADSVDGQIELARLEVADGNAKVALDLYDKVLSRFATSGVAALERAVLLLESGDASGARAALDKIVVDRPNDPAALLAAARARSLLGEAGSAMPLIDAAAAIPGAMPYAIARERGRSLLSQRIFDRAEAELTAAIAARPAEADAYRLLMETYLATGNAKAGNTLLKSALEPLSGQTHEISLLRGIDALLGERLNDAETDFLAARRSAPKGASSRERATFDYWLGRAYELSGQLAQARRALLSAVKADPSLARAYLSLGDVELQDRHLRDAERRYKTATELDPVGSPRAFLQLGVIYSNSRRQAQAKEALTQYLELDPNGSGVEEARELLARIR